MRVRELRNYRIGDSIIIHHKKFRFSFTVYDIYLNCPDVISWIKIAPILKVILRIKLQLSIDIFPFNFL